MKEYVKILPESTFDFKRDDVIIWKPLAAGDGTLNSLKMNEITVDVTTQKP